MPHDSDILKLQNFYWQARRAVPLRQQSHLYNLHTYIYQRWNTGKDRFSSCWDIRQYRPISTVSQHNFHFLPHYKSKTTEPIFTVFSHDVGQLAELLMRVSTRWYSIPFCNDRAISVGVVGNFATKLVTMATSLKMSENEGRIGHLQFNTYHTVQRLSLIHISEPTRPY